MKVQGNQGRISKWELNSTMANEGQGLNQPQDRWSLTLPKCSIFQVPYRKGKAGMEYKHHTIKSWNSVFFRGILKTNKTWKTALVFKKQQGTLLGMGTFQKIVRTPDLESRQHQHWHGAPAETNSLSCLLCISTVCSQGNEDTWKGRKIFGWVLKRHCKKKMLKEIGLH